MTLPILTAMFLQLAVPIQAPSTPQPAQLLLPAGTLVRLKTLDPLDSRTVSQGQRFRLEVVDDVSVGSIVVIPRGAAAVGEVEAVSGKGMVGQAGRLTLSPLFVEIAGTRVNLIGTSSEKGKDSTGGVAAASILTSGLLLMVTGKSASIASGSPIAGQVRNDVTLPPAAVPAP